MTDYSVVISTLQACLDNIKLFQQRYDAEAAKAISNQQKQQAYNDALAAWQVRHQQRVSLLQQGHWLTGAWKGYVWNGNVPVKCNDHTSPTGGPFNLCGYFSNISKACMSCQRAQNDPAYKTQNDCNCASCGEQCCADCNSGNPNSDIRYNSTASAYQTQYDIGESGDPQPAPPALEQLIPITFNISCQACSQIIQQGAITAGSVTQGQISQTMNCVTNQIQQIQGQASQALQNAKTAADAKAAADVKAVADALAAQAAAQKAAQEAEANRQAALASQQRTTIIMILFVFFVIVALVMGYVYRDSLFESNKSETKSAQPTTKLQ